ncbi:MAG: TonB-dependent receptor [Woeseiaceae bacterium]|nr:TonB-dependent receptor [Woeseiaceae bacterium]
MAPRTSWLRIGAAIGDARIYYSFSEGFEPQILIDADGVGLSAPQNMEQHEIGVKAELFDGAVGAAVAIFDYEIENMAVFNSFLGGFGGFGRFVLAGTQSATGAEVEVIGEILPGWNVSANYAYMDAEITDPNNVRPTPPRTTPRRSGAVTTTYQFSPGSPGRPAYWRVAEASVELFVCHCAKPGKTRTGAERRWSCTLRYQRIVRAGIGTATEF